MLNWILRLLPAEWKWQVASKKIIYTVTKLAIAGLMYGKFGQYLGSHLTPDQMIHAQAGVAAVTAAGLEGLHDFLKMRYPDSPLL